MSGLKRCGTESDGQKEGRGALGSQLLGTTIGLLVSMLPLALQLAPVEGVRRRPALHGEAAGRQLRRGLRPCSLQQTTMPLRLVPVAWPPRSWGVCQALYAPSTAQAELWGAALLALILPKRCG